MPDPATPLAAPLAAPPLADYGLAGTAVHMAVALLAILLFIFAAYWLLRRYGSKFGLGPVGRGGLLRLESSLSLGPRKNIIVVRFMHKHLVLGVTDQTITLLTEETADHDHDPPSGFAATLAAKTRPSPGGDDSASST